MNACSECGERNPGRARFCLACGRPLERRDDEARKVVSILFADVVGSTSLAEQHDAETYRSTLARYFERMDAVVTRHGGTVEKYIGDAVMAVFGVPTVHEDDALRAVRAAADIRDEVARLAEEARGPVLRWRIGVNTGEVLVGGDAGRTLATGDAVNLAARLEQSAEPGEILVGEATYALVRDAVTVDALPPLAVRGRAEPAVVYRLLEVDPSALGRTRRFDLPFVGRADELELVAWSLRRALAGPTAQLLTIYGTVGVGKTRLVTHALDRVTVRCLWGRCLPYGEGVTYWALTEALGTAAGCVVGDTPTDEVLRRLADLADGRADAEDVASVAALTGLIDGSPGDESAGALRRYLAAVAGDEGLVLILDDLHLAEPALLDVLEQLARSRHVPLLVVAIARPELLEARPGWGAGAPNTLAQLLDPLSPADTTALLDDRLEGPVDPDVAARLTDVAAGNPLFLEELVAMLLEDGTLVRGGDGRWRMDDHAGELALPASIHAVLAARVDALEPAERAVLARAAVCGQRFSSAAVEALGDDTEHALAAELAGLVERELLLPTEEGYAFRHGFVRDAIYAGLTRRVRADLHERHAWWLDARFSGPQADEFVTYHLERALEERRVLAPDDPALASFSQLVGERLAAAGCRAFERRDMPAAVRLVAASLDRLAANDGRRGELLVTLGRATAEVGDFPAADTILADAVAAADERGDQLLWADALITRLWVRSNLELDGWVAAVEAAADEAQAVFERAGDSRGLGRVWGLRGEVAFLDARYGDAAAAIQRAATLARDAGDPVEERESTIGGAFALVPGPVPVGEAEAACRALLERYGGDRSVEGRLLQVVAGLAAMRGDAGRARGALQAAVERFEELGQTYWLAVAAVTEGNVEALIGDRDAAHAAWRRGLDALEKMGDRAQAATVAATLCASVAADDAAAAESLLASARAGAAADDREAQVRVRLAESCLASARGSLDDAVVAARDALEVAAGSDGAALLGDAELTLARALEAAGRRDDAVAAATRARRRYDAKGHVVGTAAADELIRAARPRAGDLA